MRTFKTQGVFLFIILLLFISCDSPITTNKIVELKKLPPPAIKTLSLKIASVIGGSADVEPLKSEYIYDDFIQITAHPTDGYVFVKWSGTQVKTDPILLFKIQTDEWIIPIFKKIDCPPIPLTYTVKVDTAIGGTVSINPEKNEYNSNDFVKLSATPNPGYTFAGWSGTKTGLENPKLITITTNEWIIPIFTKVDAPPAPLTYAVKVDTAIGGTVSISPEKNEYNPNDFVKLSATPNPGYTFAGWSGTTASLMNPLLLTINNNCWLVPQFKAITTYSLSIDNSLGGSIQSSVNNKTNFLFGEKCSLTAVPETGYIFDGWEGDLLSTNEKIYITFDKDYQLYARFSIIPVLKTYTLTTSATNGSIIRTPDKAQYYENEKVRLTAIPSSGYMFNGWNGAYSASPQTFEATVTNNLNITLAFLKREWTFIVYMAADNNLEAAALADLNELEAVDYKGKPVSILVLLDRALGYDATNGDWTDTRLFEVKTDISGNNPAIMSERLNCSNLNLSSNSDTELNMANPQVLSDLLSFSKTVYAANNYGLIMWGHGTGWRGQFDPTGTMTEPLKAVAFDDITDEYMSLPEFGRAVNNKGLSVIGFDTCFGAILEVAYELRTDTLSWFIGSEGITPANGWDYTTLFNIFLNGSLSSSAFCDSALNQFSTQYSGVPNSTISKIDLSKVGSLFVTFDSFAENLASMITSQTLQNKIRATIMNDVKSYSFPIGQSDMYIDINDFAKTMKILYPSIGASVNNVQAAINNTVTSWSKEEGVTKKIGVFFSPLSSIGVTNTPHPLDYTKNSLSMNQSNFVKDSAHWVPNKIPKATSCLDKIFYWNEW